MHFSKLSTLFLLSLSSHTLACVDFSAHTEPPAKGLDCILKAALTDNGGQKCQIVEGNHCPSINTAGNGFGDYDVNLSCVEGYWAKINLRSGVVSYGYGSFSGSFGTNYANRSWRALVWGC